MSATGDSEYERLLILPNATETNGEHGRRRRRTTRHEARKKAAGRSSIVAVLAQGFRPRRTELVEAHMYGMERGEGLGNGRTETEPGG